MRVLFNRGSLDLPCLGEGWAEPGPRHVWAIGGESSLTLPSPQGADSGLISFSATPYIQPGLVERQRVAVSVNDWHAGEFALTGAQTLACVVPPQALAGHASMRVTLRHFDCARPCDGLDATKRDTRKLAVAYRDAAIDGLDARILRIAADIRSVLARPLADRRLFRAPGLALEDAKADASRLLGEFQSVGDDCEFGMVQDSVGVVVLGLFRLSSISIANLTRGLASGFNDVAAPGNFDIVLNPNVKNIDFMGHETNYGMIYHTMRFPDKTDAEMLKLQEVKRLRLLARKFNEDIALGDHLFVVKSRADLLPEQIALLLHAMRLRAQASLLWVRQGDALHPPGAAERVMDGLIAAYVDKIDTVQNISFASWIQACRSAHAVWKTPVQA